MEDAGDSKHEQQRSITVNFENLHANMALENLVEGAAEGQVELKHIPIEDDGNAAESEKESNEKSEESPERDAEIGQSELKSGDQEIKDIDGNTTEDYISNTDQSRQIEHEETSAFDKTELKGKDRFQTDEGNTAEIDKDDAGESEDGIVEFKQTELKGGDADLQTNEKDIQNEAGDIETESADTGNKDRNIPGDEQEEKAENVNTESGEMEEIAKGIIKSAVDGATEKICQEAASGNSDKDIKVENSQEKESGSVQKEPEWLDVLGNGLLKKKILKPGLGEDSRPLRENEVTIRYEARLPSGDEIVESDDNLSFVLGEQDVIAAFDLAVALMQKGEVALVETDAKYAFEENGKPPKIPPNTGLVFEIELLEVRPGPFSAEIELDRRLAWADQKRQKGNKFYSDKKYIQASMVYTRATKALEKGWMNEESEEGRIRINELRLKCYNNLSASRMKEEKWKDAMQSCRAAELLEPNNVKTLFRKGKIHCELGELDKGVAVLSKAEKIDPDNKTVAAELAKQKRRLEKQDESRKNMYRRMLGSKPDGSSSKLSSSNDQKQGSGWFRSWGRVLGGTIAIGAVLVGVYIAQRS